MSVEKAKVVEVVRSSVKMPTVWVWAYMYSPRDTPIPYVSPHYDTKQAAEDAAREYSKNPASAVRIIEIPGEA